MIWVRFSAGGAAVADVAALPVVVCDLCLRACGRAPLDLVSASGLRVLGVVCRSCCRCLRPAISLPLLRLLGAVVCRSCCHGLGLHILAALGESSPSSCSWTSRPACGCRPERSCSGPSCQSIPRPSCRAAYPSYRTRRPSCRTRRYRVALRRPTRRRRVRRRRALLRRGTRRPASRHTGTLRIGEAGSGDQRRRATEIKKRLVIECLLTCFALPAPTTKARCAMFRNMAVPPICFVNAG